MCSFTLKHFENSKAVHSVGLKSYYPLPPPSTLICQLHDLPAMLAAPASLLHEKLFQPQRGCSNQLTGEVKASEAQEEAE